MSPTQRKAMEDARNALQRAAYTTDRPDILGLCEQADDSLRAALAEPDEYTVKSNGKKSAVLTAMMNSRTKREAALAEADEPDETGLYHNRIHEEMPMIKPEDGEMSEWRPIETAPKRRTPMIVVIGVYQHYTTDPWCAWWSHGKWERWPHPYAPTHWMPLPEPPTSAEHAVNEERVIEEIWRAMVGAMRESK